MSKRILAIALLVGIAAIFSALAVTRVARTSDDLGGMLRQLEQCLMRRDAIDCARPVMKRAISSGEGSRLLEQLAPKVTALQCHYMGHVLGQELYLMHKDVESVLNECTRVCQGACVHGALGEAFTEAIGSDPDIDPEHLTLDQIREKGKGLCSIPSACHGVGHALFQSLRDFDPALSACTAIAPSGLALHCYRGVFMEYADARAERSILSDAPEKGLSLKRLDTLCVRSSIEESRACFMYLPKMIDVTLSEEGIKDGGRPHVRGVCLSLSGEERAACISGLGAYNSFEMFTDPGAVRSLCQSFDASGDRVACASGVASTAAEHEEKAQETFGFCRSFEESVVAESCYRAIHDAYEIIGAPDDVPAYCKDDERCLGEISADSR